MLDGPSRLDEKDGRTQPKALELFDETWQPYWQGERLVLMVRNPHTLFAYWELADWQRALVCRHFQSDWSQLSFYLQLYDVTDIIFDGQNAHQTRRIPVFSDANRWYIHDVEECRNYVLDFGTTTLSGSFFSLLRSSPVRTPRDGYKIQLEPSVTFSRPHFRDGGTEVVCRDILPGAGTSASLAIQFEDPQYSEEIPASPHTVDPLLENSGKGER